MRAWLVGCGIAALFTAGCAAPEGPSPAAIADRDCFWLRQVSGFNVQDDGGVRLSVGAGDVYIAEIEGPACDQIRWAEALALEARPSSFLCVGDGPGIGEIAFRDSSLNRVTTCWIDTLRRAPETPPQSLEGAPETEAPTPP